MTFVKKDIKYPFTLTYPLLPYFQPKISTSLCTFVQCRTVEKNALTPILLFIKSLYECKRRV